MLLMSKNVPVMEINTDEHEYNVVNDNLLPYQIKNKIIKMDNIDSIKGLINAGIKNNMAITSFLAQRILPITRENAKKIYALFQFEQAQDDHSKALIAIACRALSLQDNYWLKIDDDKSIWEDVDLRNNHLNEAVTQVALHGSSLTLTGNPLTPELTALGAYAKAWKREDDGLYLYKKSATNLNESKIEVMVSNLLDKTNVSHLKYEDAYSNGEYCCKCKCMTSSNVSILSAMDYESYCNRNNINFLNNIKSIDSEGLYKMMIVDYLIANRDRHGMNWGLYYNADNMQIMGLHPLFDHNNAFDPEYMKNPDAKYLAIPSMTTKEAALYAIKRVDFHFTEAISRNDFMNEAQYKLFSQRAEELNISIKHDLSDRLSIERMNNSISKGLPFTKELEIKQKTQTNNLGKDYNEISK